MNNCHYANLYIAILILIVLIGSSGTKLQADILELRNIDVSGGGSIGWYENVLDMSSDFPNATSDYDPGLDHLLDTSINPLNQFFVLYQHLFEAGGGNPDVFYDTEKNFTQYAHIGDQYTWRLSAENRLWSAIVTQNTISFNTMNLVGNPYGVTDFSYYLRVDTDGSGSFDTFRSGRVSSILNQETPILSPWSQTIPAGQDPREGFYYGELRIRAITDQYPPSTVYVPSPSELPAGWSLTVVPDSTGRGSITNRNQEGELCFQFTQGDANKTQYCWSSLSTANFDGLNPGQITALNIRLYGIEGDQSWQPPKFVFAFAKSPTSLSNRIIEWIPWSDGITQPSPGAWQTLDALVDGSWYVPWTGKTYSEFADFATEYPTAYLADDMDIELMMSGFAGKSFNLGHANWFDNDGAGTEIYNDDNRGCVDWFELGIDGVNTKYMLNAVPMGDFDGDGDVDGNDFLMWQVGFGTIGIGTRYDGDANGDKNVDSRDLAIWKSQFGIGGAASGNPINASVPEPSTFLCSLLAFTALALACCRGMGR